MRTDKSRSGTFAITDIQRRTAKKNRLGTVNITTTFVFVGWCVCMCEGVGAEGDSGI